MGHNKSEARQRLGLGPEGVRAPMPRLEDKVIIT
jgi:hypothetical protein